MKKTLLLIASVALLLVGCAKETISSDAGDGEMVNMTVSAQVQGKELTKAAIDEDGKGVNTNRCIMVLYYADKVYGRYEAPVNGYKATFDVKVPAKRTYKAVFWADCAAENGGDLYYNTADLKNITFKSNYVGNDDKRDAFFKCEEYTVENKSQNFSATLTRPFAQLNVISNDIKDIHLVELYPKKVNLSFEAATSFNAMSGDCGAPEAITYEADVYKAYDSSKEQLTLSMDYLFAGDRSTVDIDFEAPTEGAMKVEHNFSNIPYERNYRTNIIGNLLTADAHWDVTIDPKWDGVYDYPPYEAGSIAAANAALAAGETNISITSPTDFATPLTIPAVANGKDLIISVAENANMELKVDASSSTPKSILLSAGVTKSLDINAPASHVEVNKGEYTSITAKTGDNTLVIGKDVKAAKLTTTKGAVIVNGLVNEISSNVVAQINISTADGLMTYATALNSKKYTKHYANIVADIEMTGKEWVPMNAYNSTLLAFDGQEHTINSLKVTDYTGNYVGFFSIIDGQTIKNVTFKDATLTNASSNEGGRGAVIVGWSYAGVIDNCHVINSSVTGGQKVAGIVGAISVEGTASLNNVTNCSVENLTLSSNVSGDILYQAGALIGYIQLIAKNPNGVVIENNSVKNITINDAYSAQNNTAWYCGTFIGSIIRKQQIDGQKIVLNSNTISGTNTELFKTLYSSPYFGWTTNAENYTGAIAPILIDGVEWVPNYVARNITKGLGYGSLAEAVEAAEANNQIVILKAGTYTVPGLTNNITITGEGDVKENGVVFNCEGSESIASIPNGATFKNVTMNFGQSSYHGFQHAGHIIMENCVLNGLFFSYGDMTFNECTFNQEAEEYNMWCYGDDLTFDGCTFNSKGKFLNVYCESNSEIYNIVAKGCKFNTSKANKPALNIKETCGANFLKYNVTIENCSCNETQKSVDMASTSTKYVGSPIWQVDDRKPGASAITVTVDGKLLYKNGIGLSITNASQLKAFADYVNSTSSGVKGTFTLDADIDLAGIEWVSVGQTGHGQFSGTFDGQGHTISNLNVNNGDETGEQATGLFGWLAYATVKNTNINTATVFGHHNVGVIAGYLEGSTIDNCTVTGATVSCTSVNDDANGDKCGGIAGFAGNDNTPIKNCTVSNTSISAGRDAGQIAGAAKEANVTGCKANSVTVTANGTSTGANIRNEIIGRIL